jgi:hypothetical protein
MPQLSSLNTIGFNVLEIFLAGASHTPPPSTLVFFGCPISAICVCRVKRRFGRIIEAEHEQLIAGYYG